jgi:hypothetical protein
MARLQFDGDSGRYRGARLEVAGSAVLHRIRQRTEALVQQGVDPVDAAEEAWHTALDEGSWSAGQEGVLVRPCAPSASTGQGTP